MEKEILGNFIAESRKEMGMTQQALADKLHVTNTAVSKWERGLSYPDLAMLEPLADALEMTVSELTACKRNAENTPTDSEDSMRSMLDIAHAFTKKQRKKIWILALCTVVGVALLIGLIWGTVRYHQLTSITASGQVRFFSKAIQDDNYYVYVDDLRDRSNPQLLRLQCPNRLTWESITADYVKVYNATYTYNSLTCEGTLGDFNEIDSQYISPLDMVGSFFGFGQLFDKGGSVARYKRVSANPHTQRGYLYTVEIFSSTEYAGTEFNPGPVDPILTVYDCRGAATRDYDNDGIYELFVITKYNNYSYLVYDLVDGEIVTSFVDKSQVSSDWLHPWSE